MNTRIDKQNPLRNTLLGLMVCTLIGCGGGGGDNTGNGGGSGNGNGNGGGGPPPAANETVEEVLASFGIDTAEKSRVDDDGDALPASYAPLGSTRTINKFVEPMLFGVGLYDTQTQTGSAGRMPVVEVTATGTITSGANIGTIFEIATLHDEPSANTPWFASDTTARAAAAGDFDGDGHDEVAIVYHEASPTHRVNLVIAQDAAEGYALSAAAPIDFSATDELFLSAGDFDGDGDIDAVVGLVTHGADARLLYLANDAGVLQPLRFLPAIPYLGGLETQLVLSAGNIDYDNALELGIVVNENDGPQDGSQDGYNNVSARYFVLDDASTDFAELRSGTATIDTDQGIVTARLANIALSDVDGDNVDEVLLAGLDGFGRMDTFATAPSYLLEVLDDAKRGFAHLAGNMASSDVLSLQPSASGAQHWFLYVHVLGADIDGDGAKEIVTNQYVYEDLRDSPNMLVAYDDGNGPTQIPTAEFFTNGQSGSAGSYRFSWASSAMAAGDVTADKRDNVVFTSTKLSELVVWGHDQIGGWKKMIDCDLANPDCFNPQFPTRGRNVVLNHNSRAQILMSDLQIDDDSMSLEYQSGGHRFVFTEPVVIAALAAAPCSTSLGQNLDSCRTAFGETTSTTNSTENAWNMTVGGSVGLKVGAGIFGQVEAVAETQRTVRKYSSTAYTVSKGVLRETGPIEDSVIFYTVPMDVYTYTVLSHPNPNLIGQEVEVRLPREPITVMTRRETYNANTEADALKIDSAIFEHTTGDPQSYPTVSRKDQLLSQHPGKDNGPKTVGEGGGSTTLSIVDLMQTTNGQAYAYSKSLDIKTTKGGVILGFTIGTEIEMAVEYTIGNETLYQGRVGNVSSEFFPQAIYDVGLFTYIYEDARTDQTFEVLNYWVD